MPDRRGSFPVRQTHPQRPFGNESVHFPSGAGVKRFTSMLQACFRSRDAAPVTQSPGKAAEAPIAVLLASARESDQTIFRDLLAGTRFFTVASENFDQTSRLLCHIMFPILVYDIHFAGGNGLISLCRLIGVGRVPALVLLRDPCDRPAGAEVFDMLVRPVDTQALLSLLDAAYRNWESGVARRKPAKISGQAR